VISTSGKKGLRSGPGKHGKQKASATGTLSLVDWGWDLAELSERCASMPKVAGLNPSGGSESSSRSDLLLTARSSSK
jgi:hypothetical protein